MENTSAMFGQFTQTNEIVSYPHVISNSMCVESDNLHSESQNHALLLDVLKLSLLEPVRIDIIKMIVIDYPQILSHVPADFILVFYENDLHDAFINSLHSICDDEKFVWYQKCIVDQKTELAQFIFGSLHASVRLRICVENKNYEMIDQLLEIDPNMGQTLGEYAIEISKQHDTRMLESFMRYFDKINSQQTIIMINENDQKNMFIEKVCYQALLMDNAIVIEHLLMCGYDFESIVQKVSGANTNIIHWILCQGCNVNHNNGQFLKSAIQCRNNELVRILLDCGANVHIDNENPIELAIKTADREIIMQLMLRGSNPDRFAADILQCPDDIRNILRRDY